MGKSTNFAEAIEQIKKLAGKTYEEPKKLKSLVTAINKNTADFNKAVATFIKDREVMSKSLQNMESMLDKVKLTMKNASNELDSETWGIDDEKTAAKAQAIWDKALEADEDEVSDIEDNLNELDKHMLNVNKYRAPQ